MAYHIYPSNGEWRWRLKASNGEIIASGEGYKNLADCRAAIALVKGSTNAPVHGLPQPGVPVSGPRISRKGLKA